VFLIFYILYLVLFKMKVSVLTMFEQLYAGEAKEVILPGEDGEFSVWDDHQACLYALRAGKLTIVQRTEGHLPAGWQGRQKTEGIVIKRGVVRIESNRLIAMVEI